MPSPNSHRAPRARSPSPTRQPPCSRPLAPIQRPPKKRPEAFMHSDVASPSAPPVPAPPEKSCPSSLTRPTRSEASVPCQRPPRTEAPAPGLITPPSPLVSTWSDFPCSLQRPPRIKAPLPMDRTCVAEPAVLMQRPRNTEPSVPLQRPPRIKLTAPHGESLAALQIPVKAVPLVQRPPRTNPPCPSMRTDAAERPGHKEASATLVSDACAAKSTVGHKGGSADTSLEKSDRTDASDPDTDHKKASPGVQTAVKDLEAAEEASRSVEASPSEEASVVLQQRRDLSESDDLEDDIGLFISMEDQDCEDGGQKKKKGKISLKRKREDSRADGEATVSSDLDNSLDRCLDDRAKQHNLTAVNVRNILHEVITNEHVVAMMKAAMTETQELPIFEPKMTRSKLKEVVEKGVVMPTWNLSPIKKVGEPKVPQFVDIPLEEEDSSDEEYHPDEEDEDETAEESLLESDVESTASSPRGHKRLRVHHLSEPTEEEAAAAVECHQTEKVAPESIKHDDSDVTVMGPPPPPTKTEYTQDSMFMEELHAVDEELNSSMVCMDSFQTIADSLIALRTRSKRPLTGVRIGQLEAKLKAPDFTPDMYDPNTADDEDWKMWLQSLMEDDMGNEDEADDDDDDPEYNILEDMDEPDTEDLRNDRAVRITKKEVSELMEELFETFQDEIGYSNFEEEELEDEEVSTCKLYAGEPEDEDSQIEAFNNFNTPQAIRFGEPLANIINEQHRAVKAQIQFMRMKKSVLKSSAPDEEFKVSHAHQAKSATVFALDAGQRIRLQQQMQQHVQLLSQVHLLTFRNPLLSSEADTTRMFLVELSNFAENSALAHHTENPDFQSAFQASNLKDAIELLPKVHSHDPESYKQPTLRKNVNEIPSLPTDIAWILATQPVFMYPELLPVCGLKARGPRDRVFFSKAEDSLLALGLKHFEGSEFTKALISKYLVPAKTSQQLHARMKNLTMIKSPDNIVKYYRKTKSLPATVKCCDVIQEYDGTPPLEREKHRLPYWLKASLTNIEAETEKLEKAAQISGKGRPGNKYPLLMPPELKLVLKPLPTRYYYKTWRHRRPALQPLLIRPNSSPIKNAFKQPSVLQPVPITILDGMPSFIQSPRLVQGFVGVSPINLLSGEVRSSHMPSVTQPTVASQIPILQPKTTLPLTSQRVRKPRRKFLPKTTYSRSTPLIQPAPVIFTVASGAIKLVNLGTSCGVIQPVGARHAIPVTTVLLNPPSAPVNQTLVTPSFNQAIYDVTTVIHEDRSGLVLGTGATCTVKQEGDLEPLMEPAIQEQEYDYVSVVTKLEEDGCLAVDGEKNPGEQGAGEDEGTSASSGESSSEVVKCSFDSGNRPPSSESRSPQGGSCPAGLGFSSLSSNDVKDDLEFQSNCMQFSQAVRIQSPEEPEVKEEDLSPGTGEHPAELQHSDKPGQLQSPKEEEVKEEDTDESVANTCGSSRSQLLNAITSSLSDSDGPAEPVYIAQPDRPAEPVDIAQPDRPAEPVDIAQPDHPAEPVDIAQPEQHAQPDCPTEQVEHAWPDQPAEPASLVEPCHPAEPLDLTTERPADPEDVQDSDSEKTHHLRHFLEEREKESKGSHTQDAGSQGDFAQNTPPSANGDVDMHSPTETPQDPSSPLAHQEEGNEKDIPEEEEEEDFDDLTQDEDEEELSSASEESVLSVPELQETMEKLTWLASERRLSQEGDSEENSQEENSEPEEEEEEEVEGTDSSARKEEEMTDEVTAESTTPAPSRPHVPSPVPMENVAAPAGEARKGGSKVRTTIKARSRRGRARTSKDASKLLHLYDENILVKDPLREQKDMAFAQEYLNRVREALQAMPGKYEQFLHLIYQFETNKHTKTAVDLYENLRGLLCDWPQLLKDFAAFLLPEQALECGLFQEHQAFEKSRKFLRQLEICFLENPAQHQKIMKLLQSFADCSLEEICKLKAQMWQLLKGHNHLQEEFSLFFDQLRPPSSRMGEFEVLNWPEDKEYKFDGFEEVALPDVEDEEDVSKVHPPQRSKRKKEVHQGQDSDWVDGGKDCPCSCHEAGGGEQRVKRCKRRMCNHCSTKACENRAYRSRETPEVASGGPQGALRNGPPVKETGNCDGRLSFPKGTAAADRLAAGGKGANVTRGSVTTDYTVNTSKSRTVSQNRSAALADGADSHAQKPQARDRPGLSQRSGRKASAAKGPDPKLQSQKAVQSLSHQPYSPPLPPAPSSTTTVAGEDRQSLEACVPGISTPKITDSVPAVDSETQEKKQPPIQQITKCNEKEEQTLTVCAKNITVSSSGEKVILWTREADRVILTMCQERGAQDETFAEISLRLGNKSPEEVCQRFRELVNLFQAVCATSSDEEEEATEQTSDLED